MYPPHCQKVFDIMGLCQMGRVGRDECVEVTPIFEACAREFQAKQTLAKQLVSPGPCAAAARPA